MYRVKTDFYLINLQEKSKEGKIAGNDNDKLIAGANNSFHFITLKAKTY